MGTSSLPHRKALRLANFDYAEPQSYFVTIVACNRRCVFGRVEHQAVLPSPAGKMLALEWRCLADRFGVEIKSFIVMPNHLHGLVSTCEMVDPPGAWPDSRGIQVNHHARIPYWHQHWRLAQHAQWSVATRLFRSRRPRRSR